MLDLVERTVGYNAAVYITDFPGLINVQKLERVQLSSALQMGHTRSVVYFKCYCSNCP